ncbi:MAG: EamA family transporter [Haloarculaceae archaeon]
MAGFAFEPWMLALGAAAGFAVYTVILEYGMAWADVDRPALAAAFYSTLVVTAGFWALALARGIPAGTLTVAHLWPFLLAGVAYPALFRFLYFEGVDRVGASITGALMGAYPAVSVLLAVLVLGQDLGLVSGAGIVLIVVGVVLLQFTGDDGDGDVEDVVTEKLVAANPRDLLYPVAAMLFTGGAFVLIDYGLANFPDPIVATAITQTPALLVFSGWAVVAGATGGGHRVGRLALGAFVLGGAFNFVAWLSNFFALQSGSVVTVVPLLNTMPLLIMAITYGTRRQIPRSGRVLAVVVAIVAGASLVQIGS